MSPNSGHHLLVAIKTSGKTMRKQILTVLLSSALSGCAVPVYMAANLAASEAVTSAVTLEISYSGETLSQMAKWDREAERSTVTIFGRNDWLCAYSIGGGYVCIPPQYASDVNETSEIMFDCHRGQGGMVARMVDKRNAATLFCKKQDS